jgi:arylsulfatase A-like enzyme/Flp pilus assembly protein TadD
MDKFTNTRTHPFLRRFVLICSIAFIVTQGGTPALQAEEEKLNLLIITIDTLRADHTGIYGHDKIHTPYIDVLGQKGVLFTRAFSHVPLTLPSHCSLFTGNLPLHHGVRDNGYRLPDFNVTLAEILKKKNYRTAAFVGAFPLDSRFGLNKGFDVYDDSYGSTNPIRDLSFIERKAEVVNRRAINWITDNKENRFFVWIHYFDPHAPYEPPSPYDNEYAGREYDGEIAYTDHVLGELLEKLDQLELTDKTLIILTSDHGEGLGEHKEKTHGIFIYDSTLRIPLIFSNPKILPENKVISDQIALIDVMPTVLDLMGWDPIPKTEGKSLKSVLSGKEILPDRACYIESVAAMLDRNWAPLQGIRTKEWKYIDAPAPELYDLQRDPEENNNFVEERPEIARRLKEELQKVIENSAMSRPSYVVESKMDEDTRKKLMSLGYISGRNIGGETDRQDPKAMIELDNLFNDAIIASETGNMESASRMYDEVLLKQPDFIMAYEYASYNYYKMGKVAEAIALLERAAQLNATNHSLLARLGLYYQENGQIEESIELLERVTQEASYYAEAFNYLGVSYFKKERIENAVASFQRSIALDNNYAMAINNLGNCYLAQKNYDLAIKEYKKAISEDERLASAFNGLGVACYRQGLVDDALHNWTTNKRLFIFFLCLSR